MAKDITTPVQLDWDRRGLPAWAYHSQAIFEIEKHRVFRTSWQVAGHVNDIPNPGDFLTLDLLDDRALVIRGQDGVVRAFHNICRHRGTRVVGEATGTCNKAIICPFHGWAYNLDGTLRGVSERESFPPMERADWGLKPVGLEIWHGLIFVRFQDAGGPSIAAQLARFEDEVALYPMAEMVPEPSGDWEDTLDANWKNLREVDNEGYHVRQAHPALHDLYGEGYTDQPWIGTSSRAEGRFTAAPGRLWSVRNYRGMVERIATPEPQRSRWVYIGLYPNTVIGLYPDSISWYREIPLSVGRTYQHGRFYRHRDETREMRAARYLASRIDRTTSEEDHMLCVWAYEATKSVGYGGVILSDLEHGLKSFHDLLRRDIPELNADAPPVPEAA